MSPNEIDEVARQYFNAPSSRLRSLEAGQVFGQQMGLAAVPLVLGMGRTGAFNGAKRDAGIPRGQQPESIRITAMTDKFGKQILDSNGKPVMTREYIYKRGDGTTIIIQDHSAGQTVGGHGPHFNVRPIQDPRHGVVPGTQPHYPFGGKD